MSNRLFRTTAAALAAALLLCSCDGGMTEIGRNENVQTSAAENAQGTAPGGAENPETPASDNGSAPESPAEAPADSEADRAFDEYTAQLNRCRAFEYVSEGLDNSGIFDGFIGEYRLDGGLVTFGFVPSENRAGYDIKAELLGENGGRVQSISSVLLGDIDPDGDEGSMLFSCSDADIFACEYSGKTYFVLAYVSRFSSPGNGLNRAVTVFTAENGGFKTLCSFTSSSRFSAVYADVLPPSVDMYHTPGDGSKVTVLEDGKGLASDMQGAFSLMLNEFGLDMNGSKVKGADGTNHDAGELIYALDGAEITRIAASRGYYDVTPKKPEGYASMLWCTDMSSAADEWKAAYIQALSDYSSANSDKSDFDKTGIRYIDGDGIPDLYTLTGVNYMGADPHFSYIFTYSGGEVSVRDDVKVSDIFTRCGGSDCSYFVTCDTVGMELKAVVFAFDSGTPERTADGGFYYNDGNGYVWNGSVVSKESFIGEIQRFVPDITLDEVLSGSYRASGEPAPMTAAQVCSMLERFESGNISAAPGAKKKSKSKKKKSGNYTALQLSEMTAGEIKAIAGGDYELTDEGVTSGAFPEIEVSFYPDGDLFSVPDDTLPSKVTVSGNGKISDNASAGQTFKEILMEIDSLGGVNTSGVSDSLIGGHEASVYFDTPDDLEKIAARAGELNVSVVSWLKPQIPELICTHAEIYNRPDGGGAYAVVNTPDDAAELNNAPHEGSGILIYVPNGAEVQLYGDDLPDKKYVPVYAYYYEGVRKKGYIRREYLSLS